MNPADCLTGIAGGYLFHLTRLKTFTSTIFSVNHMDITWEAMKASAGSIEALQLDFYGESPNFIVFMLIMTTNMQKVFLRPLNLSTWGKCPNCRISR